MAGSGLNSGAVETVGRAAEANAPVVPKRSALSIFKNIRIGNRLLMAMALPVAGLLIYAGIVMTDRYAEEQQMQALNELAQLAPVVSALVHEMQKERGQSAGFIASKGQAFADTLPTQREDTDAKRQSLLAALDGFDAGAYGQGLVEKVGPARRAIDGLDGMRSQISAHTASVPQMASYYTGTIAKLLGVVEAMTKASNNDAVSKAITAYIAFLQAKERAGLERAMGSIGFGSGQFQPAIYRKFLQLIAEQETFMTTFDLYASAEQRSAYKQIVSGSAIDEVARMREIAIESTVTGDIGGIKDTYWYQQITAKIDLLKKVEDKVANDLTGLASDIEGEAVTALVTFGVATLALVVFTALLLLFIIRGITRPVASMTRVMSELARGNKKIEVDGVERGDEIGDMGRAVQIFKDNAIEMDRMAEQQAEQEHKAEEEKRRMMAELADGFETSVKGVVGTVSTSAIQMRGAAESMAATAKETSHQSTAVAAASEQATANVQTVASAAEELSSSIAEISRQVAKSSEITHTAVVEAERTNTSVQGLAEAADRIGEVVNLITDIAAQTNLLALNATIEAARAGDAGKGFAVVASEVKSLADQTAKATEEIAAQIGAMQSATQDSVGAIQGIGKTISEINEIAGAIAAAVEEQGAATQEIARNVQQAAKGTQEVSNNITGVNAAADQSGKASAEMVQAANDVSAQSDTLSKEVDKFLANIRGAA